MRLRRHWRRCRQRHFSIATLRHMYYAMLRRHLEMATIYNSTHLPPLFYDTPLSLRWLRYGFDTISHIIIATLLL